MGDNRRGTRKKKEDSADLFIDQHKDGRKVTQKQVKWVKTELTRRLFKGKKQTERGMTKQMLQTRIVGKGTLRDR